MESTAPAEFPQPLDHQKFLKSLLPWAAVHFPWHAHQHWRCDCAWAHILVESAFWPVLSCPGWRRSILYGMEHLHEATPSVFVLEPRLAHSTLRATSGLLPGAGFLWMKFYYSTVNVIHVVCGCFMLQRQSWPQGPWRRNYLLSWPLEESLLAFDLQQKYSTWRLKIWADIAENTLKCMVSVRSAVWSKWWGAEWFQP